MAPPDDRSKLIKDAIAYMVDLRDDLSQQQERTKQRLEELNELLRKLTEQQEQLQRLSAIGKAAGSSGNK